MKIHQMEMGGVLLSYAHPRPNQLFPNILEDFSELAKTAPAEIIAEGLSAALQSDKTASFGHLVADLFLRSDAEQRAGLLNILVEHISESSCGALANAGLFGLTSYASQISSARTMDISPEAVMVMAMEAERRDPSVADRVSAFYARYPAIVRTLGAGVLSVIMTCIANDDRNKPRSKL